VRIIYEFPAFYKGLYGSLPFALTLGSWPLLEYDMRCGSLSCITYHSELALSFTGTSGRMGALYPLEDVLAGTCRHWFFATFRIAHSRDATGKSHYAEGLGRVSEDLLRSSHYIRPSTTVPADFTIVGQRLTHLIAVSSNVIALEPILAGVTFLGLDTPET
jgi:hypothetical protein